MALTAEMGLVPSTTAQAASKGSTVRDFSQGIERKGRGEEEEGEGGGRERREKERERNVLTVLTVPSNMLR